jgi:type IV secretory pathway VirB10-like protein
MTEQTQAPEQQPDGSKLRDRTVKPEGTIPKQAQTYVIVGVSIVIVLAVLFSNKHAQPAAESQRKEPTVVITEDNDKKISDFGQEVTDEQRAAQKAQLEKQMQAQVRSLESASVMQPGDTRQSVGPQYAGSAQSAPPTPPPDPIVQYERELAYNSRFASNFAFSTERVSAESKATSPSQQAGVAPGWPEAISGNSPGPSPTPASGPPAEKRHVRVNVNSAEGQPYVLFEGTELETALVNRLDGDFSGPVKVMVTNPVYSHDRQHVLIPEGTFALGETGKVQGFGQRRLAVVFHRLIMPDGYTVDLDQFHGLNQIGETGLKDQVNHHYFQIFGSSIALGIIAGAAQSSNSSAGLSQTGSEAYRSGIAGSVSQSSTQVLDRFLNIPPTVTIREGHRVKVYFTQDLLLPAYENHTVPPNI